MRYGEVDRVQWRLPWFRQLSVDARLVLLALQTGPSGTALPGLVEAGVLTIAEMAHLSPDPGEAVARAQAAITELETRGRIVTDFSHSLVRLVDEPKAADSCKSFLQLRGWFTSWQELPPSPLKYEHIAALHAVVDLAVPGRPATGDKREVPSMAEEWSRTFGSAVNPFDTPSKGLRRGIDTPSIPATASATATANDFPPAHAHEAPPPEEEHVPPPSPPAPARCARDHVHAGLAAASGILLPPADLLNTVVELAEDAARVQMPPVDPTSYALSLVKAFADYAAGIEREDRRPGWTGDRFRHHFGRLQRIVAGLEKAAPSKASGGERRRRALGAAPVANWSGVRSGEQR